MRPNESSPALPAIAQLVSVTWPLAFVVAGPLKAPLFSDVYDTAKFGTRLENASLTV